MKLTHLIVAAVAAVCLSLSVVAASVKKKPSGPSHYHYVPHHYPHPGIGHGIPHPGIGHGVPHGARWGWRGGRRGYWYGGVWYWWGPVGVYGGSCYWNCINAGFGPGYCSAYSFNFCY